MATQSNLSNLVAIVHTLVIYIWIIIATFVFGLTSILVSFFSMRYLGYHPYQYRVVGVTNWIHDFVHML